MQFEQEYAAAVGMVREACLLCRQVRESLCAQDRMVKADASPVTVADFAVQALVASRLAEAFPDDGLRAEESAEALALAGAAGMRGRIVEFLQPFLPGLTEEALAGTVNRGKEVARKGASRLWILDPVDGTKGFIRGDQFAVALALAAQGRVVAGVLGCPNLPAAAPRGGAVAASAGIGPGFLYAAAEGQGAVEIALDGPVVRPVRVSEVERAAEAVICESVETAHKDEALSREIGEKLKIAVPAFRLDSQCKYAAVARGEADVYLRIPPQASYRENAWDHAAGEIVVREAGGEVTDLRGVPLDFTRGAKLEANFGILATNGRLHAAVLQALAAVLPT